MYCMSIMSLNSQNILDYLNIYKEPNHWNQWIKKNNLDKPIKQQINTITQNLNVLLDTDVSISIQIKNNKKRANYKKSLQIVECEKIKKSTQHNIEHDALNKLPKNKKQQKNEKLKTENLFKKIKK